jgi:ATP-dependent helicase HrpB
VGYSTRFDRRTSRATRVELLTEGLLIRRLQADPFLEGVDCVILDEFHERTLDVDLALALLADCRRSAREDLAIVVMSATLDPGPVAAFLGCPVVEAQGRTHPVAVEYARMSTARVEGRCAAAVRRMLAEEPEGHLLVFLPGVAEIERTARALREAGLPDGVDVLPLHGRLSLDRQTAALAPSTRRKVVLATNLAETSVTLEGARAVIDSGLARVAAYDPAIGLTRLETRPISRASADQRAGRAGRTGPGRCVRLWTEADHRGRPAADLPEIRRADLAPLVMQVLDWGVDPAELTWFEEPPPAALERSRETLRSLGAIDSKGLTPRGRALVSLPVHPRLGAVLLAGRELGIEASAATAVTLMSEVDPFRGTPDAGGEGDLEPRLAAIAEADWSGGTPRGADPRRWAELRRVRDQLLARSAAVPQAPRQGVLPPLVEALVAGFPGRLARRRGPGSSRYLLASGQGAVLSDRSRTDADLLFAVDLRSARRGERAEHFIRSAHPVDVEIGALPTTDEVRFDPETESVVSRRVTRIGDLVLRDTQTSARAPAGPAAAHLETAARRSPDRALAPSGDALRLLARLRFAASLSDTLAGAAPDDWVDLLPELCVGRRSFAELRRADLSGALLGRLTWKQRAALDRLAPERLRVPSGSALPVDYGADPPVLAARIQQLFGSSETPTVGGGRVPVMLHLLAPNGRPAQVTQDLAGFWERTYPQVRKELRGRYPKHPWPDDPANAEATNRAKRRR